MLQIISKTIKGLADKAYELSLKYDLKDEAKLIQQEEIRVFLRIYLI